MDLGAPTELKEVAPCLSKDEVLWHGAGESTEEHHQFIYVHVLLYGLGAVDSHDGDAEEEVEGLGLVLGPAHLPNGDGVLFPELSLQAHQEPAVAEHEGEPALRLLQVAEEPREEELDEHAEGLLVTKRQLDGGGGGGGGGRGEEKFTKLSLFWRK